MSSLPSSAILHSMNTKRFSVIHSMFVVGLPCAVFFTAQAETLMWTRLKSKTIETGLIAADTKAVAVKRKDDRRIGEAPGNERLAALLKEGLRARLTAEEKKELEKLYLPLLPKTGAHGEAVEWEISYKNDDPGKRDKSDFITLNMKAKAGGERLMWLHVHYYGDKKDILVGREKVGPYPAMRHAGKHAFAVIGLTEIRAVADHARYRNDKSIDKVILSFDVAVIGKL